MGLLSMLFGLGESEAEKISKEITTIKEFRALERKVESAITRMSNANTEKAYDNATEKHDILEEALEIASKKTLQWQFIPNIDIYTSSDILKYAYKVFSNEEYEEVHASIGEDSDWYSMTGYDEKDEPESYTKTLIKLQAIIENDNSEEEKIKKITNLVSKDKILSELFFKEKDLTPGEQWFAGLLEEKGLPLAFELYKEGYTTESKCLKIDPKEFAKRKGVGAKKVEQLKKFQEKVKSETESKD
jgi:hypothetical protein